MFASCKRLIPDDLADDLETVFVKFFDLSNDRDLDEDIEKKFKNPKIINKISN